MHGKDTNPQNECTDGETRHNISCSQLLRFPFPLFKFHLADIMELISRKTLFCWVYPCCKGSVAFLRRLVGHACRQWNKNVWLRKQSFKSYVTQEAEGERPSFCCQICAKRHERHQERCNIQKNPGWKNKKKNVPTTTLTRIFEFD